MSSPVVVCTWGREQLSSGVEEALTLGRKAAQALGTELRLAVLGPLEDSTVERAGRFGAAAVDHVDDAKLACYGGDAYVGAIENYCAAQPPALLLFNQTFEARSVAPRLAARTGAGVVMNGVDLEFDGGKTSVVASAFGGDTRVVYDLGDAAWNIVSLNDNACLPEEAPGSASVNSVSVDLTSVTERIRVVEPAEASGPRLEDAQTIVAGGRGLGLAENFGLVEQLADALGGVAGASRPIVDDGWADPSRQVGLTGKITKPGLYIAAGISGASQHMVGCSAAKTIVAINSDPDAAIFKHARWGLVADCVEILPEITRAVKG